MLILSGRIFINILKINTTDFFPVPEVLFANFSGKDIVI